MPPSSSTKKLHYFNIPDELKWPTKERNQRLTRGALMRPSVSDQPSFMHHNDSKSSEVDNNHGSKASTSKVLTEGEDSVSKNMICESPQTNKPKLLITLTREEIEEDFLAITGKKLPRNMMKRDKIVQKDLDALFPALWLEGEETGNLPKKY
ncbi:hypothetical protein L2E82_14095 [Cichorium intybus]|uniref:Uncharacterized protein n=1 Tax=Cichorium intybus TaxID=13427 RepID=A0ACB9EZ22_CICIN|nr:hypothetical protein L2E82_14095 [Cichorium intybus]